MPLTSGLTVGGPKLGQNGPSASAQYPAAMHRKAAILQLTCSMVPLSKALDSIRAFRFQTRLPRVLALQRFCRPECDRCA